MMQGLQIGIPQRLGLLRAAVTVMLILSMLCTWQLWFTHRLYPAAPLLEGTSPLNRAAFWVSLSACIMLLASLVFKWYRLLILLSLICILLLVVADFNRISHWVYVYGSILLVLIFYNGRVDDPNRYTSYFIIIQLLICSVYLYTGIHQLQGGFITGELPDAIAPLRSVLSERQFSFLLRLGWAVPLATIFISAALFIVPLRYLGITLAALLHVALLLLLWPLRGGDSGGYLFNFFMIVAVILLFSGRTRQRYFSPAFLFQRPAFYLVIALFWIMPAFNNSGKWPDACSANMYSGNRDLATLIMPVNAYLRMPQFVKNFCVPVNGALLLDHHRWSRFELGIPANDEPHTMNALLDQIEFWNRGPVEGLQLRITPKQKLLVMP